MRILLVTQLFQPEPAHLKGLEFAKELIRLGHDVEVLTGFPNYPGGKIYPGYKVRLKQREDIEGVAVTRVAMYPSHDKSGFKRALSYGSLALATRLWGVSRRQRPDVIYMYQGAATLAWIAMHCKKKFGIPYVLDVQDLWPDSVTLSGMLKVPYGEWLLNYWCKRTYDAASRIIVLSEGYKRLLIERSVPEAKIEVIYNWSDERNRKSPTRSELPFDEFGLAGRFNVMFAGNMGKFQSLKYVLDAAEQLETSCPKVRFVLVGDGVDRAELESVVKSKNLGNVLFIPRQPAERMQDIFAFASATLIHLRDDRLTRVGIPQKTQAYMAAGRPIIAAVRGDTAALVKRSQAGLTCESENSTSIAKAVKTLLNMSEDERESLSKKGIDFYEKELSLTIGVKKIESILQKIVAENLCTSS